MGKLGDMYIYLYSTHLHSHSFLIPDSYYETIHIRLPIILPKDSELMGCTPGGVGDEEVV